MRIKHLLIIVVLLILSLALTASASYTNYAPVPRTGQTECWDSDGNSITCTGSGQDGEHQMGVAWPDPRFTDNNDGTVTDNLTGLIWLKNANCPDATRDWPTAFSDVASLNAAGTMNGNDCGDTSNGGSHQTDWRMPNVREMHSLVDYTEFVPALPDDHPFTGVESHYYWTSTTLSHGTDLAWFVYLHNGWVSHTHKTSPGEPSHVWPVRGESAPCPSCATGGATEPFKPMMLFGPWLLLAAAAGSGIITAAALTRRAA